MVERLEHRPQRLVEETDDLRFVVARRNDGKQWLLIGHRAGIREDAVISIPALTAALGRADGLAVYYAALVVTQQTLGGWVRTAQRPR